MNRQTTNSVDESRNYKSVSSVGNHHKIGFIPPDPWKTKVFRYIIKQSPFVLLGPQTQQMIRLFPPGQGTWRHWYNQVNLKSKIPPQAGVHTPIAKAHLEARWATQSRSLEN